MPLVISGILAYKASGDGRPLDIQVTVRDILGVRINGATVNVTASNGTQSWSGTLANTGNGIYTVCNVGSFNAPASAIRVNATASKVGYSDGSGSGTAQVGNLTGCP